MIKSPAADLSVEAVKHIRAIREQIERDFLVQAFDYLRENAISGDLHEYCCDRRPVLPLAIDVGKTHPVSGMKFFGFGAFQEPRVVPGRAPKTEGPLDVFVSQKQLRDATSSNATLLVGPAGTVMATAERDRFMNTENKVALAIVHAPEPAEVKPALEFAEPLLTEGSLVYLADLNAGYRRTPAKDVGRAFLEFQRSCRFQYVRFLDVGWWGRCYMACLPAELPLEKL
jgi:hypothetical protein